MKTIGAKKALVLTCAAVVLGWGLAAGLPQRVQASPSAEPRACGADAHKYGICDGRASQSSRGAVVTPQN
ncbi:MAG TPA: hypothetical protein VEH84_15440 [Alphaproteobacteria bacterium]|nr:hypothetical protein [Alphaproteobacteria bacterium]